MGQGGWQLTTEKLSQVVTLMAPAVPDAIPSLQLINTPPSTSYAAIGLANVVFLVSAHKNHQKQSVFSWYQQCTFTFLPWGDYKFVALGQNLIWRNLVHLYLSRNITLVYSMDDIIMTGSGEQEEATTLDLLVTQKHIRGWERNTSRTQGPSTSVKFLGV